MRFENFTKIDDALLREVVRFVCPSNVSNFDIAFKNSNRWHGRAYTCGTSYHIRDGRMPRYVIVHCPRGVDITALYAQSVKRAITARMRRSQMGYMTWNTQTQLERLVHITAHELRHLWQRKVPKGWRVWGARGRMSERDADAYAIRMVRAWRRERPDLAKQKINQERFTACVK